ncbi:hypothetical protein, partial [Endozoicomonas acroporae]|uniref:hypothetical protein n=1 Tax=Endozoicomonas acroporae TaxID=1701104 RepID=UPI0013D2BA73
NTTAVNSTVETSDDHANAAIGGGVVYDGGTVANTTAMNSTVETSGDAAYAGIGGGCCGYRNGCQHHGDEQHGQNQG